MDVFTVTVVVMIMIFATVCVTVRYFRHKEVSGRKVRIASVIMCCSILLVISDMFAGKGIISRLPSDLIFSLAPLLLVTSSLWDESYTPKTVIYSLLMQPLLLLYNVISSARILPHQPSECSLIMAGLGTAFLSLLFLHHIHMRVREVRLVIKHGNVWDALCMMVDGVHLLFIVIYVLILLLGMSGGDLVQTIILHLVSLLLALEFGALGFRLVNDSAFVLRSRHERRIVESMKLSSVEVSPDSAKIDQMYKNIYERLVNLFETDRIYLNSDLTINDVVKIIYTNKLYISRAISQFTGRNFCQFVNYYRVIHSIKLFRDNPDLKVLELANRSGFNSSVTYSMAFRLYMSESPSDWCRKEKYKITRKKK